MDNLFHVLFCKINVCLCSFTIRGPHKLVKEKKHATLLNKQPVVLNEEPVQWFGHVLMSYICY